MASASSLPPLRSVRRDGLWAAVLLLFCCGLVLAVAASAARARSLRAEDLAARQTLARLLPAMDVAITSGGRAARFPALEDANAAFQSGPALLDDDPANSLIAPPREVWLKRASAYPISRPALTASPVAPASAP